MLNERMCEIGSARNFFFEQMAFGRERAKAVGPENVFDFSIGNPSVPPPEPVMRSLRALMDEEPLSLHGYTPQAGSQEAREAVAAALNRRHHTRFTAEAVTMTCGAAAALTAVARALTTGPETEFIVFAPFFSEYLYYVGTAGAKIVVVPADTEDFQIDFAALERAITPRTQAVIIDSPNNPSGAVYTAETLRRLAEILTRRSESYGKPIYLISDEPYRELYYGEEPLPFVTEYYRDAIVDYSYSKCFSMPGERIGWLLLPDELTDCGRLRAAAQGALRSMGQICAPSGMQKLIARCADIRPDLAAYRKNRDLLYGALTEMGYRAAPPMGAFYVFVEAPGGGMDFTLRAREEDILVVPGEAFACPTHARISYCVPYERVERALPRFERLLRAK
ncbi:MAG: pyridoxal phosphate-dependent aminotransferase [Clostridia bacterium]|nr:pyridoxal phosphate-dependent aminotransferase [Clostridia bacterium]